jgi:NAD(P)-dependent dehydrogenase (short-subunit alcohol dehydrogenase family)
VAVPEDRQHSFGAAYAMAKTADDRLALAAAVQLREHDVASVAVHPGWVRTEGVLQFAAQLDLAGSQSPEGVGRAIVALASDPELLSLTGQALGIEDLAVRYGIDVST